MKFHLVKSQIKYFFTALFFLITFTLSGQDNDAYLQTSLNTKVSVDIVSLIARQTDYVKSLYSSAIEAPKELINGKEYEPYYQRSEVKPLLFPEMERTATIFTKTRQYRNLSLQYDTYLDEVVYTDTSRTIDFIYPQIALNKDIVKGFNLYFKRDSLVFRNFSGPECLDKKLEEGFYEVVYEGPSSYIIKHESSFYERQGLDNYKYTPKNYISTGGVFTRVKNQKSLLLLFGAKAHEVKNYIHSSGIKFKKADKYEIESILKFYDSLVKA